MNQFGSPEVLGPSPEVLGLSPEVLGPSPEVWGRSPEVLGPSPEVSPEVSAKMCQKLHFGCGCDQMEQKVEKIVFWIKMCAMCCRICKNAQIMFKTTERAENDSKKFEREHK